jgi:GT2 family glycosyltransferase
MKKLPVVTISVLNYNGLEKTRACLISLIKTTYPNYKIIVADNGSTTNETKILKNEFKNKRIEFIRFNKNYGFAGGHNKIVADIRSKYIVLLNNDTEVDRNWLTKLVDKAEEDYKTAVIQPKIIFLHDKRFFEYAGAAGGYLDSLGYPYARGRFLFHIEEDRHQYDDSVLLDWSCGSALFFRRSVLINTLGLFDTNFFAYHEEIDFCLRVKRAGYLIRFVPQSVVYHSGVITSKKKLNDKIFWTHRNNLYMILKNFSLKKLIWLLPLKIILDYMSMLFYFTSLKFGFIFAVFRAHFSFLKHFKSIFRERQYIAKKLPLYADKLIYGGHIIIDYFILGRRKFSDSNILPSLTSHSMYYGDIFKLSNVRKKTILTKSNIKTYLLFLVVAITIRLPFLSLPLNRDEGGYAYVGYQWMRGAGSFLPYRDAFEHKLPLAPLIYGLTSLITPDNLLIGIRIASIIFLFFLTIIIYRFLKEVFDKNIAFWVTLFFIFLYSSSSVDGLGFNTEAIFIVPTILAYYLLYIIIKVDRKRKSIYLFGIGLLLGVAILAKQVAVFCAIGISILIAINWFRKKINLLKYETFFLFGLLTPLSIIYGYFYAHKALWISIYDSLLFNILYVRDSIVPSAIETRAAIQGNVLTAYLKWFTMAPRLVLYLLPFSLVGWYILYRNKKFKLLLLLLILTVSLFTGAKILGSREAEHYYLAVIPALSLSASAVFIIKKSRIRMLLIFILGVIAIGSWVDNLYLGNYGVNYKLYGGQADQFAEAQKVGEYIKAKNYPAGFFMWGNEPEMYYFSEKRAFDRNMNFYGFYIFSDSRNIWWRSINKKLPLLIVAYNNQDPPMYGLLQEFLKKHREYKKIDTIFKFYNLYVKNI